eukprot:765442-Hanusia_phi.AAC.1
MLNFPHPDTIRERLKKGEMEEEEAEEQKGKTTFFDSICAKRRAACAGRPAVSPEPAAHCAAAARMARRIAPGAIA